MVTLKIGSRSQKSNHFLKSSDDVSVPAWSKTCHNGSEDRVQTRLLHTEGHWFRRRRLRLQTRLFHMTLVTRKLGQGYQNLIHASCPK